ncbi:glycosyltransferase family protein [Limnospira fusiformis]|uniref:glycosyltransferase family protein n=1 Tax=Limnospira fusiformis TaxID=54297 RepID=UPI001448E960|nr:glycosyltransferase [Limnospira fusiformis SAG 85.79]
MANYERYQSLVKEAWQHYSQGDRAGMARSLEQSLEYTPYLKSETISDWVTNFEALSSDNDDSFDIDSLTELNNWNKLILHTLELPQLLRIACVMDDFTYHSYKPECQLFQLTPENILCELELFQPQLLFVESAWRGKNGLWNRKISTPSQELIKAIKWCQKRQIPTVFWNKEDPIHFETFLTTAHQFDYVFTTDIDCINRYKAELGHDRIYLLPFACQTAIHNPIELYERKDMFSFAGAYYVRYPERIKDLENFVTELPKFRPLEIYDRNLNQDDQNYQFPPEYKSFIVGSLPFHEINKAYKGYHYAINLNSIKQSQTMFARRVYELLASNTLTISNFSRGLRLMFGDLVISADSGSEIVRRLEQLVEHEEKRDKFRLAGLRKVMLEHTYTHRLAYIANKALKQPMVDSLPAILVIGLIKEPDEYDVLVRQFKRQSHTKKRLVLVFSKNLNINDFKLSVNDEDISLIDYLTASKIKFIDIVKIGEWVAPISAMDYYGPNYLLDLVIATRYSKVNIVGKVAHYEANNSGIQLDEKQLAYREVNQLPARASIVKGEVLQNNHVAGFIDNLSGLQLDYQAGLSIDPFNYCKNGQIVALSETLVERVDDLKLNTGISSKDLLEIAEGIPAMDIGKISADQIKASELAKYFGAFENRDVNSEIIMGNWRITSQLPDGKHQYFYAQQKIRTSELKISQNTLKTYFDVSPGLNLQLTILFFNKKQERIGHVNLITNRNNSTELPPDTVWIQLGLRVYASGKADIKGLQWSHRQLELATILGQSEYLLLTNNYPQYNDLYRNGFVHSRVRAYRESNLRVDVFRLRKNERVNYHEFQDVDVITGTQGTLDKLLSTGRYKCILVHFLDINMWEVLQKYVDKIRVIVWVHGSEVQPWYRRDFNYTNDHEREVAKKHSELRINFWRSLLGNLPKNIKFVFVSNYLAEQVMEDVGIRIPGNQYSIIHNPIDTDIFTYYAKSMEKRKKILSIRPYASRVYANDLSVQAIIELSKKPYFNELEFMMVGDGKLFEETLEPLRCFKNVTLHRCFLKHQEIANLHREYGVFLCPTRSDTQGVSRDEAMSSGLVVVTNNVAAIPEFVDKSCGILCGEEDSHGLAEGISLLYENPEVFIQLSENGARKVRQQSGKKIIISKELVLIIDEQL